MPKRFSRQRDWDLPRSLVLPPILPPVGRAGGVRTFPRINEHRRRRGTVSAVPQRRLLPPPLCPAPNLFALVPTVHRFVKTTGDRRRKKYRYPRARPRPRATPSLSISTFHWGSRLLCLLRSACHF